MNRNTEASPKKKTNTNGTEWVLKKSFKSDKNYAKYIQVLK